MSVVRNALWHYMQHCAARAVDQSISAPSRSEWSAEYGRILAAWDVLYDEDVKVISDKPVRDPVFQAAMTAHAPGTLLDGEQTEELLTTLGKVEDAEIRKSYLREILVERRLRLSVDSPAFRRLDIGG